MTIWGERYRKHELWVEVANCRGLVNSIELDPGDRNEQDALAHIGMVLELLEKRHEETDPREVTSSMLARTHQATLQWNNALVNVRDHSWNATDAIDEADAVLDTLASWPPMKPARYLAGIGSATEAFQNRVADMLEDVTQRYDTLVLKLEGMAEDETKLRSSIDAEKQRISEAIADFKTVSKTAVDELIAEENQRLAEARERETRERSRYTAEAQNALDQLRKHEETARDTVHATTASAVATDYGKYARNKAVAAWVCDIGAALIGAVGVAAILFHLFTLNPNADTNLGISITRLAASLGALGVAALLGKRAAQHHRESRAAKRTDLALRRVMPFIVNLPADEQELIVLDFTERVFIRGELDESQPTSGARALRERVADMRRRKSDQPAAQD
ncbi:hypothetical protein SAMN04515691_3428 [Leifsonia sp. 98AMF]|uniref:hypothetical protein n=1 Tax=unclassified Leifsonia TaxID=2663824 RepID=UPI00087C5626|nr:MULTISPECIES: hypothetical protein [unclassified Leifsonia]SDH07585.1 hypothetical protein SAMN04515690_0589 [Leifsonia sp. 197AMF]SDJ32501.1 hypothetical protein SAMN04515684_3194 [Leifsonia sp. 466MF]SDK47401.1 hypothetical protein SAMN04515683_3571 [Leifsonia sp. 157MF]SDN53642.1 hypothetical protein SAMN04515686_1379 [Leifsonia sp. 509MF]SEN56487.1 hypothetical protein SAMN04515685_3553 [Leifsonia sp. 467MF]